MSLTRLDKISSCKYTAFQGKNEAVRITLKDGSIVVTSLDAKNIDYQIVLDWAAIDGNNIEAAD